MPTAAHAIGSLVHLFLTGLQRRVSWAPHILNRLLHLLLEVPKRWVSCSEHENQACEVLCLHGCPGCTP